MKWLHTFGWAAYLACSWTWCIGMFLPVLLIRDFGPWSFIVFAVPNVVGAAAMGWVLTRNASEALMARHKTAMAVFSCVTAAFQFAFLGIVMAPLVPPSGSNTPSGIPEWLVGVVAIGGVLLSTSAIGPRGGAANWVLSAGVGLALLARGDLSIASGWDTAPFELLALTPVCCFGFVLCPYLDRTFHTARQNCTDPQCRIAFTFGFCVLFLAMILLTLGYAHAFLDGSPRLVGGRIVVTSIAAAVFGMHIFPQLMFTILAHLGAWIPHFSASRKRSMLGIVGMLLAAPMAISLALPALLISFGEDLPRYHGLTISELTYRFFMSFYGLYFPAYVWLCMIPTRDGHSAPRRDKVIVWALACALASPCYWMGFIERQTWWLVPGVALVLLARLFIRGGLGWAPIALSPRPTQPSLSAHAVAEASGAS